MNIPNISSKNQAQKNKKNIPFHIWFFKEPCSHRNGDEAKKGKKDDDYLNTKEGKNTKPSEKTSKKKIKRITSTKSDVTYLSTWAHIVHLETWIVHYPDQARI